MSTYDLPAPDDLFRQTRWLRSLAERLAGPGDDPEDLVQGTLIAAWKANPSQPIARPAWLARVLRNQAAHRVRDRLARGDREWSASQEEGLPSAAELSARADVGRRLIELVLELPDASRRVVLARFFEGLSSAEIARRLECPEGTVRSQLKRGLDQLRARIDAESEGARERWLAALAPIRGAPDLAGLGSGLGGGLVALSMPAKLAIGAAAIVALVAAWRVAQSSEPPEVAPRIPVAAPELEERSEEPAVVAAEIEAVEPAETRAAVAVPEALPGTRPIEGRLVHPDTLEPVVWYELAILPAEAAATVAFEKSAPDRIPFLEDGADVELLRTDDLGEFRTERGYEPGEYAIVPLEAWRLAESPIPPYSPMSPPKIWSVEHDEQKPERHQLELVTGPVFRLECAKLEELGPRNFLGVFSYVPYFPPGYFHPVAVQAVSADAEVARGEAFTFVRLWPSKESARRQEVDNLQICSNDGTWRAVLPMEYPESVEPRTLRFNLDAAARVEVGLDWGELRAPFTCELRVWHGEGLDPRVEGTREPDIAEINARFDGLPMDMAYVNVLPTGPTTIAIAAGGFELWTQVVDLAPGLSRYEAQMLPLEGADGELHIRVEHAGEEPPPEDLHVTISGEYEGAAVFKNFALVFEPGVLGYVSDFRLEGLPHTEYMVWFGEGDDVGDRAKAYEFTPFSRNAMPDGERLDFELSVKRESRRLRVRVEDGLTGKRVDDFTLRAVDGTLASDPVTSKRGKADLKVFTEAESFPLMIYAEGYELYAEATPVEADSRGRFEAKVELQPGWGVPFSAGDAETFEPLEGVEVWLDGVLAGVTDENGDLFLRTGQTPERIEARYPGYELVRAFGMSGLKGEIVRLENPNPSEVRINFQMSPKE